MFPLGIIPAIIGITLFFAYFLDKDEVNRYWFLIWGMSFMAVAFFIPNEITSETISLGTTTYVYGVDPALAQMGIAFTWLVVIFIIVLFIRLLVAQYWENISTFYNRMRGR